MSTDSAAPKWLAPLLAAVDHIDAPDLMPQAADAPAGARQSAVLVLSHQAGVFEEIGAFALGVHPLDVMDQADALHRAITMPQEERRARLNASRAVVERNDAGRWLDQQLQDVEQIRTDRD